jgi:hypothetical protein
LIGSIQFVHFETFLVLFDIALQLPNWYDGHSYQLTFELTPTPFWCSFGCFHHAIFFQKSFSLNMCFQMFIGRRSMFEILTNASKILFGEFSSCMTSFKES